MDVSARCPPLWRGHSYTVVGCKTTSIGKYGAIRLGSGRLHVLGGATGPLDEAGWLADGMWRRSIQPLAAVGEAGSTAPNCLRVDHHHRWMVVVSTRRLGPGGRSRVRLDGMMDADRGSSPLCRRVR